MGGCFPPYSTWENQHPGFGSTIGKEVWCPSPVTFQAPCRLLSWAGSCSTSGGRWSLALQPDPRVSSPRRVLLCARQEFRPMEWITQHVLGAVAWLFPTAYSVPVETVARAMVASVLQPGKGKVEVLENKAIHQLGKAQPQLGT